MWSGDLVRARDPGITEARDPLTGKVVRTRPNDQAYFTPGMSHAMDQLYILLAFRNPESVFFEFEHREIPLPDRSLIALSVEQYREVLAMPQNVAKLRHNGRL